ncbi:arginine--tRNA ligase [Candidatus Eisenbacteria bacterium]|uniref:Arginine--tRNA ligase n=1 Tax=Eiseniibacteriota bacterium TaxID=2212470 RepID=A0ABV6YNC7_UNCEI
MKGYALEKIRDEARGIVIAILGEEAADHIRVEFPPPGIGADLAIPLFPLAKVLRRNPNEMASEVAEKVETSGSYFREISAAKGFVNFHFDWKLCNKLFFDDFLSAGDTYGSAEIGTGKTIVIDYSAPNIAKPFSVGHLRSTVIGQALYNILLFLGYTVIGDNHIGDWGTQFGKILAAYDRWGDEKALEESPTRALLDLYVKFHDEAETDPSLLVPAREWFAKLEVGDDRATQLWSRFRELSLREFERIYDLLGVSFDHTLGESFYNDRLKDIVKRALDSGVAECSTVPGKDESRAGGTERGKKAGPGEKESDGTGGGAGSDIPEADIAGDEKVILIPLAKYDISAPLILQKSDGTSLYATRELATLEHRVAEWTPHEVLYVVGAEQSLYFTQFFKAIELLGIQARCVHVPFGMIRLPEGRMSTRKGRVIFLEDLLAEAIDRAGEIVKDRDLSDEEKREIARLVGVGAVKYADLSQDRTKDIVFDWKKMMALEGNSGPYLQYAYTRAASIMRKAGDGDMQGGDDIGDLENLDPAALSEGEETALLREIARFPEVIKQAAGDYKPNYIANYLFSLSQVFNRFYVNCAVLKAETAVLRDSRLALVAMTRYVLRRGLGLLGIDCPEKM